MTLVKICCAAALGVIAQATAKSSVLVRNSAHLTSASLSDETQTLSEEDVSFLMARLSGDANPLESKPPTGLPVPDLFHEPAGTVMLVVTGSEADKSPELSSLASFSLEDSSTSPSAAIGHMLSGSNTRRTGTAGLCASLDKSVTSACDLDDSTVVSWDAAMRAFSMSGEHSAEVVNVDDLFSTSSLLSEAGLEVVSDVTATHTASGISFDLTDLVTVQMLSELELFHQLPTLLNESLPRLAVLSLVGPQMFTTKFSDQEELLAAMNTLVLAATPLILEAWNKAYDQDSYEVLVFRNNVDAATALARRRLLTSSIVGGSSTTGYTYSEIADYQVFTWTWFILILIVFFAACNLGTLDIGSDEAGLYSNFKAGSYDRQTHEHSQ
jgi:hypothetical protein